MEEVTIIGVDLAKNVFQVHGAAADGSVVFRKKLSRPQFSRFMAGQSPCQIAMEACPSAHHWARELTGHGHRVRLIAPHYVKPFLTRQKNDAADAEAIVEAALRPTMRFVEPKSTDQQARAVAFPTREQLVKQRTEGVNALRSHLYEFGHVAPVGIGYLPRLGAVLEDPNSDMPPLAREICRELLDQIVHLTGRINAMKKRIDAIAREGETSRRLQTMPGVGPISALAVETFAPPMEQFKRGRDFAAWLGLVPRQASTGGKQKLGKTSKMGQRDIHRLLITGAMAVIRWALRHGAPSNPWLARTLQRKPPMLAASALANKMARGITDATTEKVAELLAQTWRGLLMSRDELSGWLASMDRYSGGGDRPFWLEAYGGRSYPVDRKSSPEPIIVDHLTVAVLGGTQPDKLARLLVNTDDDGLLARFLTVFPDPVPLSRPSTQIDTAMVRAALERLRSLGAARDDSGVKRPFYIVFSDAAADALQGFH
ncbi:transposase IS116/IS110/IS902 family protein [Citreicella sp. 357]|nr:transposase IS116/IS110/IS902 family protein [Citreicella sp. 357]